MVRFELGWWTDTEPVWVNIMSTLSSSLGSGLVLILVSAYVDKSHTVCAIAWCLSIKAKDEGVNYCPH